MAKGLGVWRGLPASYGGAQVGNTSGPFVFQAYIGCTPCFTKPQKKRTVIETFLRDVLLGTTSVQPPDRKVNSVSC